MFFSIIGVVLVLFKITTSMMILLLTFIAHSLYNYINAKLIRCNANLSNLSFKLFDVTIEHAENKETQVNDDSMKSEAENKIDDDDPELFLFNESFDANLFKLRRRNENSINQLNSTYDVSCNFELLNDLNKLYKNTSVNINDSNKNDEMDDENNMSTSNYHLDDNMISQNYFYENDINSLKFNSMNMDMDVNNPEQTIDFNKNNNTTNAFIDMIMMSDNMDFTEEAEDYNEDEEVFDSINFNNTHESNSSSSVLSSTSSLSSIGFIKEARPFTHSQSSHIKMQNSYTLLKRRIMGSHKRKHLNNYSNNNSETNFSNNNNNNNETTILKLSQNILYPLANMDDSSEKKRFRTRGQRVKHARKFYQRQRTSSTKLSIDLNDKLTKLHYFVSNTSENHQSKSDTTSVKPEEFIVNSNDSTLNCMKTSDANRNTNLKIYKPSFKVEKLLNDSRGMKKYLIDYDCLMKSNKQQQHPNIKVSKTFSLNNLSSIVNNNASSYETSSDFCQDDRENLLSFSSIHLNKLLDLNENDSNLFDQIRSSFLKLNNEQKISNVELTPDNLNDCMMKKFKNVNKNIEQVDEEDEEYADEDHYYEEEEEIKSYSSFSNKCSSGYLSDF